jgi:hypothetical protein
MTGCFPDRHLGRLAEEAIASHGTGASFVEVSVQRDRTVVQLSFKPLPRSFGADELKCVVSGVQQALATIPQLASARPLSGKDPAASTSLWIFIAEDYGMGSCPICNWNDGVIEWTANP